VVHGALLLLLLRRLLLLAFVGTPPAEEGRQRPPVALLRLRDGAVSVEQGKPVGQGRQPQCMIAVLCGQPHRRHQPERQRLQILQGRFPKLGLGLAQLFRRVACRIRVQQL
jgi:hypothetical protein